MRELKGSTIWDRKTLESDIFFKKPSDWFKIWFFLVNMANHSDNKQFKRGECLTSYKEIMQATGTTRFVVDNCTRWLKRTTMITTRKTTRGFYVYITKYSQYQDAIKKKNDTKNDNKNEIKTIQERYRNGTINNNDNNDKNYNNDISKSRPEDLASKDIKKYNQKEVKPIMDCFQKSIPGIKWNDPRQHEAVQKVYEQIPLDQFEALMAKYVKYKEDKFCPIILSPAQFWHKLEALKLYLSKQEESNIKVLKL